MKIKKYAIKEKSSKLDTETKIHHDKKESVRLNKYISNSGFCSRREADRLIENKRVSVDGLIADVGTKVNDNQVITVDNKIISNNLKQVYIALNKPKSIVCITDTSIEDNITTFMNYPERIFPIGRLDKDSSGLILLTNDGDVVNKILRSTNNHEKEYIVKVDKLVDNNFIDKMQNGIKIYNPVSNKSEITKKCNVEKMDKDTFKIILTQGLNRQIRRMCSKLGYKVITLKRIRIMNIMLDGLKDGEWRYLTKEELTNLNISINK